MSSVTLGPPNIEGRIWPRRRVENGGRYLVFPPRELFSILECPGNRVRYKLIAAQVQLMFANLPSSGLM
jgi:hypothetical protein